MTVPQSNGEHHLHYKSLGRKFVWWVLAGSVVIALLITALQTYFSYRSSIEQLDHHFIAIENSYLPSLAAGMWSIDHQRINTLLDGMSKIPDVGAIELQGELGERWVRQQKDRIKLVKSKQFPIIYKEGEDVFPVGNLKVSFAEDDIRDHLLETATKICAVTFTILALSAALTLIIFKLLVSRHIKAIAIYVHTLDLNTLEQEAKLHRPISSTPDELDVVILALNRMQSRIREDMRQRDLLDHELHVYREQLEQLVNERTLELKVKSEQLEKKTEELLMQNRDLDAYAHTVAHDLKQPISNLLGVSSILTVTNFELDAEKTRVLLTSVQRSANKMKSIIDSLLLLASVRKGEDLKLKNVLLQTSLHEAEHRLITFAHEHRAEIRQADAWPMVIGENQWIEEVWCNYLSNAIKYGGNPPKVEVGWEEIPNGFVKCWVKDNGKGISETDQKELFEQFARFDEEAGEGHGLGLSIVKRIVQRLGGDVGYEKLNGEGSIFWFTLKLANNEPRAAVEMKQ